jgi:hypothetical protein
MLKLFFKPIVNTIITLHNKCFFPEMIGDEAKIYIRVARGETDVKITFLQVKFEELKLKITPFRPQTKNINCMSTP